MERPTVLIISDEPEFSRTLCTKWQTERNSPSFSVKSASECSALGSSQFDLAVVGPIANISEWLDPLRALAKPIIHIFGQNGRLKKVGRVVNIPEVEKWPEVVITMGEQLLEHERTVSELGRLADSKSQLEREASLGRYILEMRHNLNNALTSILGNSELMLFESDDLRPKVRQQIETIRNMGMRMNEIMQRFSSLQKEMQLVEQVSKRPSKAAAAGV